MPEKQNAETGKAEGSIYKLSLLHLLKGKPHRKYRKRTCKRCKFKEVNSSAPITIFSPEVNSKKTKIPGRSRSNVSTPLLQKEGLKGNVKEKYGFNVNKVKLGKNLGALFFLLFFSKDYSVAFILFSY